MTGAWHNDCTRTSSEYAGSIVELRTSLVPQTFNNNTRKPCSLGPFLPTVTCSHQAGITDELLRVSYVAVYNKAGLLLGPCFMVESIIEEP